MHFSHFPLFHKNAKKRQNAKFGVFYKYPKNRYFRKAVFFRYLEKGCFSKYKGFLLKYEILWNMKSTEIPRCRDSESFLGWELGLEGCPSGEGVHSRGGVSGREVSPVGRSGIRYRRALCWDAPPVSGGGGVGGQVWGGRSSPHPDVQVFWRVQPGSSWSSQATGRSSYSSYSSYSSSTKVELMEPVCRLHSRVSRIHHPDV